MPFTLAAPPAIIVPAKLRLVRPGDVDFKVPVLPAMFPFPTMMMGAADAGVAAWGGTWNPSDKDSSVALTNGNLTATRSTSGQAGVRGTVSSAAGPAVFEITRGGTGVHSCGLSTSGAPLNNILGAGAGQWGWRSDTGAISNGGTVLTTPGTYSTCDFLGIKLVGTSLLFYKNGTLVATVTVSGGPFFPAVSLAISTSSTVNLSGPFSFSY